MTNKNVTVRQIIFLLIFFAVVFGASRIALFKIIGAGQSFTLFEFIYPLPAVFLGSLWGAGVVLLVRVINWAISGKTLDLITFLRFFPVVFAAIYFSTRSKLNLLVPIICMILFWAHPIGRAAFPYGLFWFIPLLALPFKKNIALNSLGTTFTAHAIGSVVFLYTVPMSALIWRSLIPVVIIERFVFATGIATAYICISLAIKYVVKRLEIKGLVVKKVYNQNE